MAEPKPKSVIGLTEDTLITLVEESLEQAPTFMRIKEPDPVLTKYETTKVLDNLKESKTAVIISTGSGTGLAETFWKNSVQKVLQHFGLSEGDDYVVHYTQSTTTITELTKNIIAPDANNGIVQTIILLSGDGGVVDMVNALQAGKQSTPHDPNVYASPKLILFPLGTGNALANSIGVSRDSTLGLSALVRGTPKPLPIFCARFSPGARLLVDEGRQKESLSAADNGTPAIYGAVVCSWGFHATLVADSDTAEYRKHGAKRFQFVAQELLSPSDGSGPHAYRGKVSYFKDDVEGQLPSDQHGYVLVTMVSNLEKTFRISPASKPLDGKLRMIHFGPLAGEDIMQIMTAAYQDGRHVEDKRVWYDEVREVRIELEEDDETWRRVCVDGRIVAVEGKGWVSVQRVQERVLDVVTLD